MRYCACLPIFIAPSFSLPLYGGVIRKSTNQAKGVAKAGKYLKYTRGIDGIYPFSVTTVSGKINLTPFRGDFFVILYDFIRQNYHKNQSDRYPFFLIIVNYPVFL